MVWAICKKSCNTQTYLLYSLSLLLAYNSKLNLADPTFVIFNAVFSELPSLI